MINKLYVTTRILASLELNFDDLPCGTSVCKIHEEFQANIDWRPQVQKSYLRSLAFLLESFGRQNFDFDFSEEFYMVLKVFPLLRL